MQKIKVTTLFDITATGALSYKPIDIPGTTKNGVQVNTQADWFKAVNQQRNWDTVQQVLSLRTQLFDPTTPTQTNGEWSFVVEINLDQVHVDHEQALEIIKQDFDNVPIIDGLDASKNTAKMISTTKDFNNLFITQEQ